MSINRRTKGLLSWILTIAMVVSLVPAPALAEALDELELISDEAPLELVSDVQEIGVDATLAPPADDTSADDMLGDPVPEGIVARNVTTSVDYETLAEAIAAAADGDEIQLLDDETLDEALTVPAGVALTLDLNGRTITCDDEPALSIEGALTVTDGTDAQEGTIEAAGTVVEVATDGTLSLEAGSLNAGLEDYSCDVVYSEGTVYISGGSLSVSTEWSDGIYNDGGTVEVSGGTIVGTHEGGIQNRGGTVYVSDGTIIGGGNDGYGGIHHSGGELTISGGTIEAIASDDDEHGGSAVSINGGNVTISDGILVGDESGVSNLLGNVSISGGTITGGDYGGICNEDGSVLVAGGTVSSAENGITNFDGDMTIEGGTVLGTNDDGSGIYNSKGALTIRGGEVSGCYAIVTVGNGEPDSASVTVTGGKVTGIESGISSISDNGDRHRGGNTIVVEGGEVEGGSDGIYLPEADSLTIGKVTCSGYIDEETAAHEHPTITGGSHGIVLKKATLAVHCGTITGGSDEDDAAVKLYDEASASVDGGYYSDDGELTSAILAEGQTLVASDDMPDYYQLGGIDVAQVIHTEGATTTTTGHPSLYNAFYAAADGDTVRMLTSERLAYTAKVPAGKNLTLDLNGRVVYCPIDEEEGTVGVAVVVQTEDEEEGLDAASLVVCDSSKEQTGAIVSDEEYIAVYVRIGAEFTLEGGTISGGWEDEDGLPYGAVYSFGTVNIAGGNVTSDYCGVYSEGDDDIEALVTVSGGTVTGGEFGGVNTFDCDAVVTGGTVTGERGIDSSYGDVRVSGGNVIGDETAIDNYAGKITIEGGKIAGDEHSIYCVFGGVDVSGGDLSGAIEDIYGSKGTKVSGGTITSDGYTLITSDRYGATISGGTIISTGEDHGGVFVERTDLTITGGEIFGDYPVVVAGNGRNDSASVVMTGGRLVGNKAGISGLEDSDGGTFGGTTIEILGGTVEGVEAAIQQPQTGTLTIGVEGCADDEEHDHPTIVGEQAGIDLVAGTLAVHCGAISGSDFGIVATGGAAAIDGGVVLATGDSGKSVHATRDATMAISGGAFSDDAGNRYELPSGQWLEEVADEGAYQGLYMLSSSLAAFEVSASGKAYTGEQQDADPVFVAKHDGDPAAEVATGDYTLAYYADPSCSEDTRVEPLEIGTYYVVAEGTEDGPYAGTRSDVFEYTIGNMAALVELGDVTYGDVVEPKTTVLVGTTTKVTDMSDVTDALLAENPDAITYTYTDKATGEPATSWPLAAGTYTVTATIAETESFNACTASTDFCVLPRSVAELPFEDIEPQVYTGSAIEPGVVVSDPHVLVEDTASDGQVPYTLVVSTDEADNDYSVEYRQNVGVGVARATITGHGNYTGSTYTYFAINEADETVLTVDEIAPIMYDGTTHTPEVVVRDPRVLVANPETGEEEPYALVAGKDYVNYIVYANNTEVGTATAVVILKGNYEGAVTATFEIYPAAAYNKTSGTYYGTLAEAVANACPNDRITMLIDETIDEQLVIEKSLTFDLDGHDLSVALTDGLVVQGWDDGAGELSPTRVTFSNGGIRAVGEDTTEMLLVDRGGALYLTKFTGRNDNGTVLCVDSGGYARISDDSALSSLNDGGVTIVSRGTDEEDNPSLIMLSDGSSVVSRAGVAISADDGGKIVLEDGSFVVDMDLEWGFAAAAHGENSLVAVTGGDIAGQLYTDNGGIIDVSGGWFDNKVPDEFVHEGMYATDALDNAPEELLPYTVLGARFVAQPTAVEGLRYNGETQRGLDGFDYDATTRDEYRWTGEVSAREAGDHEATFSLNDGWAWATFDDEGNVDEVLGYDDLVLTWTIEDKWERIWGQNGYDTMQAIVNTEGVFTRENTDTVVVASRANWKDPLAATALAGVYGAPLLLVGSAKDGLPEQTAAELERLQPSRVIVIGGTDVVSVSTFTAIRKAAGTDEVDRIAGSSAVSRANGIVGYTRDWGGTAILATQNSFRDTLSAATLAYAKKFPIVFVGSRVSKTEGGKVSADTIKALKAAGIKHVVIVGGKLSVSGSTEATLKKSGLTSERWAGDDGLDTSAKIAKKALDSYGMTVEHVSVARSDGNNYVDALSGAALTGKLGSVLVLADGTKEIGKGTKAFDAIRDRIEGKLVHGHVYGGTSSFSEEYMDYFRLTQ